MNDPLPPAGWRERYRAWRLVVGVAWRAGRLREARRAPGGDGERPASAGTAARLVSEVDLGRLAMAAPPED